MSIIEELYYGNISPAERDFVKNSKYDKAIRLLCSNEDLLRSSLKEEDLEHFTMFSEAEGIITDITGAECFKSGFRIGIKLMCDVFFGESNDTLSRLKMNINQKRALHLQYPLIVFGKVGKFLKL